MTDRSDRAGGDALLPCPFCGEQPKAYWQGASPGNTDDGYFAIECCHVFVHTDDEADAAHDWNLREPSRPTQGQPAPEARYIKRDREFIERGLSDASNSADPALAADARRALDAFLGAKP